MDQLGIKRLAKQKAYTLSGGERRRLEITRALVTNPSAILLDEPFSGVDPLAVYDVQEIIRDLKRRGLGDFDNGPQCAGNPDHRGPSLPAL